MPDWSALDLDALGNAEEVQLSTKRHDGSLRDPVPVWVVRVGNELFVRSYRGRAGSWYRHARRHPAGRISAAGIDRDIEFTEPGGADPKAIDEAYRGKYGRNSYTDAMVGEDVAATTLRLTPR